MFNIKNFFGGILFMKDTLNNSINNNATSQQNLVKKEYSKPFIEFVELVDVITTSEGTNDYGQGWFVDDATEGDL